MYLHHILRVAAVLVLLAGSASAKKFDRVPDLLQLVKDPVRAEYRLVCPQNVDMTRDRGGFKVLKVPGGDITLDGFRSLKLVLMFKPGKPSDKIATVLLVDRCIESETTYTITSDRVKQATRDDPTISLFQQKTRPE